MTKLRSHLERLGASVATILITGCVATDAMLDTRSECTSADWEAIGLTDGKAGQNTGYIAVHRDNCAVHAVVPDVETYQKGYVRGVIEYCTKERGYIEGGQGRKYQNACPAEIEAPFMEGYAEGLRAYRDQKEFRRTQMREHALGGGETISP